MGRHLLRLIVLSCTQFALDRQDHVNVAGGQSRTVRVTPVQESAVHPIWEGRLKGPNISS